MMVVYEPITTKEFESLPTKPTRKTSRWDEVLSALAEGQAVRIPGDQKAQRGARIALGRLSKQRNLTLEYRSTPDALAIRASSTPLPAQSQRGRPRTNKADTVKA